jgi:hypothetical protein
LTSQTPELNFSGVFPLVREAHLLSLIMLLQYGYRQPDPPHIPHGKPPRRWQLGHGLYSLVAES